MARRSTSSVGSWFTRGVSVMLLVLVLAACQSTDGLLPEDLDPTAESLIDASGFRHDDMRVLFLPPIGHSHPKVDSDMDLDIEVLVFNVDPRSRQASGSPLGPVMTTDDRSITANRKHYTAVWNVSLTAGNRAATSYVRLEFRVPGNGTAPLCNDGADACLGYLDVKLEKSRSHRGHHGRYSTELEAQGGHVPRGFIKVSAKGKLTIPFKVAPLETTPPPETLGELATLTGEGNFDEQAGNCASSEFSRPGQGLEAVGAGFEAVGAGLEAVGAVGGLFTGASYLFQNAVVSPGAVADQLWDDLAYPKFDDSVALLVVDDFGGVFDLPHELFGKSDIDLQALVDQGRLAHGTLVLHHVLKMAKAALPHFSTYQGTNPKIDGDPYYKFHDKKGHYLMVQVVDVAGYDTQVMADRIRAALSFIGGNGGIGIKQVVVNMSFAIVPCAVASDVGATVGTGGIETFESYLGALAAANNIGTEYLDELGRLVSTPVALTSDPLFAYLTCPLPTGSGATARCDGTGSGKYAKPTVSSIMHVAASGNFGNEYALYPAAWPTVVSVGSLDVNGAGYEAGRSAFSNAATVLAPGNSFLLNARSGNTVAYAGTSFSAPVVSVFSALDQMLRTTQCAAGSVSAAAATAPALAGSSLSGYPLVSTFAGGTTTALEALCQTN